LPRTLSESEILLRVDDLAVTYRAGKSHLPVARNLSFEIHAGEAVGLLGESGSGKTTTALALLSLLPTSAVSKGSARFRGVELMEASEATLQKIRGARISFVPQEPLLSLNPVIRAIDQVSAVLRAHTCLTHRECRHRARAALEQAGLDTERLHRSYPHQLSGGQRQRVLIAQAIVCRPSLVIADEPTGSLDEESEQAILALLRSLVDQLGASLLLITHDPRILAAVADRVMVMYAGRIVESGPKAEVLETPLHPYTRGLLQCIPDTPEAGRKPGDRHVPAIEGSLPDFNSLPPGCPFEPRCQDKLPCCREAVPAAVVSGSQQIACFLYGRPQ
jgi:peptide/nickel transport system ATP-binding protein